MHIIGHWIESLLDAKYYPPQELVGDLSPETRARVASYLDSGSLYRQYRGLSWCRFGCGHQAMGSAELTDGVWVWPGGLSHYVRNHAVVLPDEFIAHILAGGSKASEPGSDELPDDRLWLNWCQQRSTGHLRSAINQARNNADLRADELRRASWREMEVRVGVSNIRCMHRDCSSMALTDMALCSMHSMSRESHDPGASEYFTGLLDVLRTSAAPNPTAGGP